MRLWQDIKYVSRQLVRAPGFTIVVVLTFALGIGATTAIFSAVYAVVLRPFPFPEPDRVIAIGDNVKRFAVGDRVLTTAEQGGYAEQAVALAEHCYRIPDSMPFTDAAAMALAFDTAWFALHERGRLRAGETVLVLGATGAVGLAAIQLAKAFGARVIAGVSSMSKADIVTTAGADGVVDLSVENLRDGLRDQVHALTDGRGADVVIDSLGDVERQLTIEIVGEAIWQNDVADAGEPGHGPTLRKRNDE